MGFKMYVCKDIRSMTRMCLFRWEKHSRLRQSKRKIIWPVGIDRPVFFRSKCGKKVKSAWMNGGWSSLEFYSFFFLLRLSQNNNNNNEKATSMNGLLIGLIRDVKFQIIVIEIMNANKTVFTSTRVTRRAKFIITRRREMSFCHSPFPIGMNGDGVDRTEMSFHSGEFFFEDHVEKSGFEFTDLCCCLRDLNQAKVDITGSIFLIDVPQ